ncbi:hypothetical protein QBC40DRAFT_277593 [Triangularia verruculosa]|uniref:Uncharacterized protein n=1 Tax=Triangularia verruculosa TaxID=2587418 RepID=A0AAN6XLI4_9PEZI|nr:hypothetical protein QBC40DRAFT_277593 [Triangularia verruculosa]
MVLLKGWVGFIFLLGFEGIGVGREGSFFCFCRGFVFLLSIGNSEILIRWFFYHLRVFDDWELCLGCGMIR